MRMINKDRFRIQVIGPNKLQNELFLSLLVEKTGSNCATCPHINWTRALMETRTPYHALTCLNCPITIYPWTGKCIDIQPYLILLDCMGLPFEPLFTALCETNQVNVPQCVFAFFNVDPTAAVIDKKKLNGRLRGIFQIQNMSLDLFIKGIQRILDGGSWFFNEIQTKYFTDGCIPSKSDAFKSKTKTKPEPTPKELEILSEIASGFSYKSIARKFDLSINTVKTHIYNIYQKINVTNRLQAIIWMEEYQLTNRK